MRTRILSRWKLALLLGATLVALVVGSRFATSTAMATHLSSGCRAGHRVALTFDDGPNQPYTGRILDELVAAHARATFFVEGEAVAADPDTVRREVALGMALGSHSATHSRQLPQMDEAAFRADLDRADAAILAAAGFSPALYRPPYGHKSRTMLHVLRSDGYISIGWDLDSRDWSNAGADDIVANVLKAAHPGAIVLMHDGGLGGGRADRSTTLDALPRIIDGLLARGYELATVPELAGIDPIRQPGRHGMRACPRN